MGLGRREPETQGGRSPTGVSGIDSKRRRWVGQICDEGPEQDKIRLVVEFLFARNAIALIDIAGCIAAIVHVSRKAVDPFVRFCNGLEAAH